MSRTQQGLRAPLDTIDQLREEVDYWIDSAVSQLRDLPPARAYPGGTIGTEVRRGGEPRDEPPARRCTQGPELDGRGEPPRLAWEASAASGGRDAGRPDGDADPVNGPSPIDAESRLDALARRLEGHLRQNDRRKPRGPGEDPPSTPQGRETPPSEHTEGTRS